MSAVQPDAVPGTAGFDPLHALVSLIEAIPWSALFDLLLLAFVIVTADFGVFSEADGVVAALLCALLRPALIPYLLFLVAGFQDAKGLNGHLWYGGTVLLGAATLVLNGARVPEVLRRGRRDFLDLVTFVLLLITYAVFNSYLQRWFGLHKQATAREPIVVALLALAMMSFGTAAWERISKDPRAARRIVMVLLLMFGNGLAVSIARLSMGYQSFVSAAGEEGMEEGGEQLYEDTPLGFPRMTGTYLTPIGFAMYIGYMLVLWQAAKREKKVHWLFVVFYCLIGLVLSLISLSKDMALFFVITTLAFGSVRPRLLVPVVLIGAILAVIGLAYIGPDAILDSFRVESGTSLESYRAVAWSAVLENFTWSDWLFGTGLAYWPVFLEKAVGFTLSDPHTYLLSIPGTYGVAGVAFYVALALFVFSSFRRGTGYLRLVAVALGTMFYIVDLTSIPYIVGNTPLTMLIWTAMSALGMRGVEPQGKPADK